MIVPKAIECRSSQYYMFLKRRRELRTRDITGPAELVADARSRCTSVVLTGPIARDAYACVSGILEVWRPLRAKNGSLPNSPIIIDDVPH